MDASQITGATSSYARKYALNGLFAIDDTKDADATNKGQDEPKPTKATAQPTFTDEIRTALAKAQTVQELVETFGRLPQALRNSAEVKSYCAQLKSNLEAPKPATQK